MQAGDDGGQVKGEEDACTAKRLRTVSLDVIRVFGEGANVEVRAMVVGGESVEEGVHGWEEGIVVAHCEPLAVWAGRVVVECREEGEVPLCHMDGAVGGVYIHVYAQRRHHHSRLLELGLGSINQAQDEPSSVGLPPPVCQPMCPFLQRGGFGVGESAVRS